MEKLYTSAKTRPGADCGSDHELLVAKFRLRLKKEEKTTGLPRNSPDHLLRFYLNVTPEVAKNIINLILVLTIW